MNVLIVDDQRVMREIVKMVVAKFGHEVLEADCGERALELVNQEKVDIVLLDVEMPGLNGFETAKAIREAHPVWFPIIFLSAKTESEFFVEGIRSGGDVYLHKPVVPEVLEAMVNAMHRIVVSQEELHRANVQMELYAHRDDLTGLVNRRGFDRGVELEFDKAKIEHSPLSLIMIDVDHFKDYNDNHGHVKGDECLRAVAGVLKKAVCREADVIARYGGEEFIIILPNTSLEHAKIVANRIMLFLEEAQIPHGYSAVSDYITVSGGMVQLQDHEHVSALIQEADAKLYDSKSAGRNRIC